MAEQVSDKGQAGQTLPYEPVPNDMVGLPLGKAHLSKLKRLSNVTLKGCLAPKGLFHKDGCFGPSPLQYWV